MSVTRGTGTPGPHQETGGQGCSSPGHALLPQGACSGCYTALSAELTALRDRHMRLMAEAGEDRRKAREAAERGEIVPLPHNRVNGTESVPQGFEAVMATDVLQLKGRCKPPAEDEVVLCVFHRTTGGGRSILLERSQVEALHEWLGKWLADGWPGVPRKCGRHHSDDVGEWRCDQEPGHASDHEGNPIGWRSGRNPGRTSWPQGAS